MNTTHLSHLPQNLSVRPTVPLSQCPYTHWFCLSHGALVFVPSRLLKGSCPLLPLYNSCVTIVNSSLPSALSMSVLKLLPLNHYILTFTSVQSFFHWLKYITKFWSLMTAKDLLSHAFISSSLDCCNSPYGFLNHKSIHLLQIFQLSS